MDRLAGRFLSNGDVANASSLYTSLEKLNPGKYNRMARICRVLLDPQSVPLPHRHRDICDALLDPAVPPEVLLRDSPEDVQKTFQRLAVCVHPDKNPNPDANEAFLRLTVMKNTALMRLQENAERRQDSKAEIPCASDQTASGQPRKPKPKIPPLKKPASPVTRGRRPPRSTASLAASISAASTTYQDEEPALSVSSSIAQLRSTKITLNALKRKEISNDFEIFSSPQRVSQNASAAEIDDSEEVALASTVPVLTTKKRAKRVGARRGEPCPHGKRSPCASETATRSGSPLLSCSFPHRMCAPLPVSSPLSPREVFSEAAGTDGEAAVDHVPGEGGERDGSPAAFDENESIRRLIDETCAQLRAMRPKHTSLRLNVDLSFEAYERRKAEK